MTTVREFLENLRSIRVPPKSPLVVMTVAEEIRDRFAPGAAIKRTSRLAARGLLVSVDPGSKRLSFRVEKGRGVLSSSHESYLYAWLSHLTGVLGDDEAASHSSRPVFAWQRPIFDLYFAQSGRSVENLDRETYVRTMARLGFTHLEVNSLAFPEAWEEGVPGEVYPRFYTYCPALDQFVSSRLNRGVYPKPYLRANLARLKEAAELAERYGLTPTLTCFEPRSVPESFFERYPELRGCRVDHPFRSFKPRYNLAVAHPVVKEHYRELMRNLMTEVPRLGCLSLWTNDSGAGCEFTKSLYVGANGSAYLVREWSEDDVFARSAADNVTNFLRLLKDAAAEINPEFRVTTRLEPFGPERERVIEKLGDGIDVEVPTLLATGWDAPYGHPRYADSTIGPFTIFNNDFRKEERAPIRRLAKKDCRTHVMHAHGPVNNFEPLMGIPTPWLTREKLFSMQRCGAEHLAHFGGIAPPDSVPYSPNEEVFARFQLDPHADIESTLLDIAAGWAGEDQAERLVSIWRLVEKAIRGFMPNPLYFLWGVWYRLQIRPLVPDIDAIPERRRAYYERHLLSTHHNPNRVDLSRDVLFTLVTKEIAAKTVTRIDRNALPPLDRAVAALSIARDSTEGGARSVFADQHDRIVALRCWMETRRNVAAWIANVHGYVATEDRKTRATCRANLAEMVAREIANAKALLAHRRASATRFMAISSGEETTFIYDRKFDGHLKKKIRLMEEYGDREPRIDPDFMWRVAKS